MSLGQINAEVLIVGDVCPATVTPPALRDRLKLSDQPDWFIWTLDASLPVGPRRENYTSIPFDANSLGDIALGHRNAVVLAANHAVDFGSEGLLATTEQLQRRGWLHCGAGATSADAARPVFLDTSGGRVALLAYAESHARVGAVPATATSAGVNPYEYESCVHDIRRLRKEADSVWVILHWGEEFVRFPAPWQREQARSMIEAGATLVAASHTHVPLGYERYREGSIFYGLGNFLYPPYRETRGFMYRWHPQSRRGVIVSAKYNRKWEFTPHFVRHDARGIPNLDPTTDPQDLTTKFPASVDYARVFPNLRSRERLVFKFQRLCWMTWQERVCRIKSLLGVRGGVL